MAAGRVLGIDIGGTKCAVLTADTDLGNRRRVEFPTETGNGPEQCMDRIIATARAMLAETGSAPGNPMAIGVSCGGPLDAAKGIIQSPPNLPGWDGIPIGRILGDAFGCAVKLQNDANACAMAEWRYGSGQGTRNFVFLTFGTGMGAGVIVNGGLLEGANGNGGEVGHIRLAPRGPVGYGKKGSFEGFCSGGGIARLAADAAVKAMAKGVVPPYCRDPENPGAITAKDVAETAKAGDPGAIAILRTSGRYLGMGLSILIDVLNPEVIAIGSIFKRCHGFLWPPAEAVIRKEALGASASACRVVPAELDAEIGDYACLGLAVAALEGH